MSTLSPEEVQEVMLEVAQENAAKMKDAILGALDDGWLIFKMGTTSQQLDFFKGVTLAPDAPLVLSEGYLEGWRAGVLPQLQALTDWQMVQAQGQPVDYQRHFWGVLTIMPPYVFEWFQAVFRKVVRAQMKRLDEAGIE